MFRAAAGVATFALASVFALATYEVVLLVFAITGSAFGGAALIWLVALAKKVDEIQEAQGSRISELPDPDG